MIDADARPLRAVDAASVVEGDRVRLKFLYPNGALEVMECTWMSATNLGAPENPNGAWVVLGVDDRVIMKPLSHLIELEVLEANEEARTMRRAGETDVGRYHR